MKVLQIAPLCEGVPPPACGDTETVVSVLIGAPVRAGHEVVLCASEDSLTLAPLRSVYPRSLRTSGGVLDRTPYDLVHTAPAVVASELAERSPLSPVPMFYVRDEDAAGRAVA